MSTQSIQIIYEDYDVIDRGGNVREIIKNLRVATIPFGDRTTPYVQAESYTDNFESMVYDIMQNGFVYVGHNLISILNIKKFLAYEVNNVNRPERTEPQKKPEQMQQGKGWRKNDRRFKKRQSIETIEVTPVKPEEVLKIPTGVEVAHPPQPTGETIAVKTPDGKDSVLTISKGSMIDAIGDMN